MSRGIVVALRDMLREEFGLADNRDMAVAEAVRTWYFTKFPHLGVLIDQPDLAAIIAKVRTPAPSNAQSGHEQIFAPSAFLSSLSQDQLNAARYLALRNLPVQLLDVAGVPCIAVPEGRDHGKFVTEEDADRAVDLLIETMKRLKQ